jgi:hypothetical protein
MDLQPTTRPITGSHVYTAFKCMRNVVLDVCGDRSLRRDTRPEEEHLLARGRDHEAKIVVDLIAGGWCEPEYAERDFAAGAAATRALLEAGVPGVLQAVLLEDAAVPAGFEPAAGLGIPDLLRRVEGRPEGAPSGSGTGLGFEFHYEVGDVKSSARPRGDQILQVVHYATMLARVQGCLPKQGYLLLKDGREERFDIAEYVPVLEGVIARIQAALSDPASTRPFLSRACGSCRWSVVCGPELEGADDLSLVDGMSEGVARTLRDAASVATASELAVLPIDDVARRTGIDAARLRRLQRAAFARQLGRPLPERVDAARVGEPRGRRAGRPRGAAERPATVALTAIFDAFADRLLWCGASRSTGAGRRGGRESLGEIAPGPDEDSWQAFLGLVARITPALAEAAVVWHVGPALPRWIEDRAFAHRSELPVEADPSQTRFVDALRRARGAATWPRPVHGFDDVVALALDRDPHRAGRLDEAAWRVATEPDAGRAWLSKRGGALLEDVHDVVAWIETAGRSGVRSAAAKGGGKEEAREEADERGAAGGVEA